jgi:hypothetical protein
LIVPTRITGDGFVLLAVAVVCGAPDLFELAIGRGVFALVFFAELFPELNERGRELLVGIAYSRPVDQVIPVAGLFEGVVFGADAVEAETAGSLHLRCKEPASRLDASASATMGRVDASFDVLEEREPAAHVAADFVWQFIKRGLGWHGEQGDGETGRL